MITNWSNLENCLASVWLNCFPLAESKMIFLLFALDFLFIFRTVFKIGSTIKTIHNLRDYTFDAHKTVDGRPFGGGFGMVFMVEPILKTVRNIKRKSRAKRRKIILLSAKGKQFNQTLARQFSKLDQLVIISGRYEGVDERVAKYIADEEISIGEYILTGGELPAMAIVDAITRLIPGAIADGSLKEES